MKTVYGNTTFESSIDAERARDGRVFWSRDRYAALLPGMDLFHIRRCCAEPNRVKASSDMPVGLVMQVLFTGQESMRLDRSPARIEPSAERFAVYSVPGSACAELDQPAGVEIDQVFFMLSRATLTQMLPAEILPASFAGLRDGRIEPFAATPVLTAAIAARARALRERPFEGAAAGLYAQSHLLGMLAGAVEVMTDGTPPALASSGGDRRRAALAARDLLLARLDDPPSLADLAAAVGVGPKRLNAAFRETFGAPIFDCLMRWRLDAARRLIVDGALPLKQIAHRVGYRHVSNFTTAYARAFGETPTATRVH